MDEQGVQFADVESLVRPQSVAVVGASGRAGSMGNSTFVNVLRHSRIPRVFAVNPSGTEIEGVAAQRSLREIDGGVDVAIVVVAAPAVPHVMRDCVASGTRNAIVLTSGFAEMGEQGASLEAEMLRIARSGGVRVYGPNCPGLTNVGDGALLSMSPAASASMRPGPVGLVTQGGGLGRSIMQNVQRRAGVNLWCSPGNESDLDICDFMNYMVGDDRIRVIGAVVEGFRDGGKFVEVARRAAAARKPIVILKIGRSEYGERAAASHTAAMSGSDAVVDAIFDQFDVVRADDVSDLCDVIGLFASRPADRSGCGVCVYTFSGGTASLAADIVGYRGLKLAQLGEPTRNRLRSIAPPYGLLDNPIDLTTDVFTNDGLNPAALRTLISDEAVDVVMLCIPADYGDSTERMCRETVEIFSAADKQLLAVWMSPSQGKGYDVLADSGFLPFLSITEAVTALGRVERWAAGRPSADLTPALARREVEGSEVIGPLASGTDFGGLARAIIDSAGIRIPRDVIASSEANAVSAAGAIGYPVAMKIVDPTILHKSDVGGVALDLRSSDEVTAAYRSLTRAFHVDDDSDGVRVQMQCMIGGSVELILGYHHDGVFGGIVTVGAGGLFAEYERDVVLLRPPFNADDVRRGLRRLRVWPRLSGARGATAVDVGALAEVVMRFGGACLAAGEGLASLEVNPLVPASVPEDGGAGFYALDLLWENKAGSDEK